MNCRCGHGRTHHNFWITALRPHGACMRECWCTAFSTEPPIPHARRIEAPGAARVRGRANAAPPRGTIALPWPAPLPLERRLEASRPETVRERGRSGFIHHGVIALPWPAPLPYERRLQPARSIELFRFVAPPSLVSSAGTFAPYYLSIVAVCKDENAYLPEWLEYHRLVGVDHVFLYDNRSRTPLRETCAPWVADGFVTVVELPGRMDSHIQRALYNRACRELGALSVWLAFIDIDEFIFPKGVATIPEILYPLEERWGGLTVLWRMFGINGHSNRPSGLLQIEAFTRCEPWKFPVCRWGFKSIVRPTRAADNDVHQFGFHDAYQNCDGAGMPFSLEHPDHSRIQINHYWSRSMTEFREKIARCQQAWPKDHDSCMGQLRECELEVDAALPSRWARKLRAALRARGLPPL